MKFAKNYFFPFSTGYGMRKMTEGVWRVFLLFRSTFPGSYLWLTDQNDWKWPKFFVFGYETMRVQSNGHMVGLNRSVNYAVSWSYAAFSPRYGDKFSPLPFQILSFAQGRINWAPMSRLKTCRRKYPGQVKNKKYIYVRITIC